MNIRILPTGRKITLRKNELRTLILAQQYLEEISVAARGPLAERSLRATGDVKAVIGELEPKADAVMAESAGVTSGEDDDARDYR